MNVYRKSYKAWVSILRGSRWKGSLLPLFLLAALVSEANAQGAWYSIGPRVGYTFGQGFTAGFELTYFPAGEDPYRTLFLHGYTLDVVHVSDGPTMIHVGTEWMFFAGIDVGPTLVFDSLGVHAGATVIGFASIIFIPYYEATFIKGNTITGLGGYLKFPVGLPSHTWN
jgi:hypothetical protein